MTKSEVVAPHRRRGLSPVSRQESQDVCFIPEGRYGRFLAAGGVSAATPGPIEDLHGNTLGQHPAHTCLPSASGGASTARRRSPTTWCAWTRKATAWWWGRKENRSPVNAGCGASIGWSTRRDGYKGLCPAALPPPPGACEPSFPRGGNAHLHFSCPGSGSPPAKGRCSIAG